MRTYAGEMIIMDAKAITGIGTPYSVPDFMNLLLTLSSASSANFTIKFQGSMSDTVPNFAAARSNTNRWDYIQVKDYQNNTTIDGDTGITFAGTDDVRIVEANTNGLKWLCAEITAISAGSASLRLQAFSNQ